MLLPRFEVHRPTSLAEVTALIRTLPDFDWYAGGTDLLPNYKCRLNTKPHVVMLDRVAELGGISPTRIGAFARLSELEHHPEILAKLPALAETTREISSPLLRESGTVGGNVCLDNRCYWFNQSEFWREAKGGCLKEGGPLCLVVPQQKTDICWATYSGDLAPMLQVLGARIGIAGPDGGRVVSAVEFFQPDGIRRNVLGKGELVTHVELPTEAQSLRAGYLKLRQRDAIDFPILGVAAAFRLDAASGAIADLRVSVTAVDVIPIFFDFAAERGKRLDGALIERIAAAVQKKSAPKKNVSLRPTYRRKMAGVFTRRLLSRLAGIADMVSSAGSPAPSAPPRVGAAAE
jgi:4-hydroxybenzoyl-CoA reductase subunit beta